MRSGAVPAPDAFLYDYLWRSGHSCFFAREKDGVYVVQIATVAVPEIADLRFQIDQFNTVRETVVHMFNMFVVNAVALDEARLNLVK